MSDEPSWVGVPVAPSPADDRIEQMVSDPASYFTRSRREAEREAKRYVARRIRARLA